MADTRDGYANDCRHDSATGVDTTPVSDPSKVWRCDHCGLTWRADGDHDAAVAEAARAEAWDEALRWVRRQADVTSPEYVLDRIDRAEPFNPYRRALSGQPAAAGCPTEGCGGDGRYAAPGRGHAEGCTYPLPAAARTEGGDES